MTAVSGTTATRPQPRAPRPSMRVALRRRTLVALLIAGVVAVVAFNVGRQAFLGLSVDQQAEQLQAEVLAAQEYNAALQRQLEYLQSDAYVTAEARRLANLGYPGEQLLIIPPAATAQDSEGAPLAEADDRPMLERWLALFLEGPSQ